MRMTIAVVGKDGHPADGPVAEFGEDGGTIGRRVDCTLVIADDQRHISRVHALVEFRGDYFCIVDKGSYIAVRVNGLRVGRGQETPIFEGDEIVIGGYTMRVTHVAAAWDLEATLAVPALTFRDPPRPPVVIADPAPAVSARQAADGVPAGTAAVPNAKGSDGEDASSDGNGARRRKSRGRRKTTRAAPAEVPLEAIRDNPTSTHEPGRTLPPEESVARMLAAEAGAVVPDFDIAAEGGVPGASVAERPGQSTFDLLADRLLEKGDLAYDPFMPSVWDERVRPPAADGASPAPVAVEAEAARDEVAPAPQGEADLAPQPVLPDSPPAMAEPWPAPEPVHADEHVVAATSLTESPSGELPAALMPESDDAATVVKEVVGETLVAVAVDDDARPAVLEGEVMPTGDPQPEDIVDVAAQTVVPIAADNTVAEAEPVTAEDAEVLARVVRRRHRGNAAAERHAEVPPVAADAEVPDKPEIVLVLQPLAAGDEGELVVPIRRRNRRASQQSAG